MNLSLFAFTPFLQWFFTSLNQLCIIKIFHDRQLGNSFCFCFKFCLHMFICFRKDSILFGFDIHNTDNHLFFCITNGLNFLFDVSKLAFILLIDSWKLIVHGHFLTLKFLDLAGKLLYFCPCRLEPLSRLFLSVSFSACNPAFGYSLIDFSIGCSLYQVFIEHSAVNQPWRCKSFINFLRYPENRFINFSPRILLFFKQRFGEFEKSKPGWLLLLIRVWSRWTKSSTSDWSGIPADVCGMDWLTGSSSESVSPGFRFRHPWKKSPEFEPFILFCHLLWFISDS